MSVWDGPLVLKGIQTVDDAKQAVAVGVAGIGLSNHGGRQLDDAPAPIELIEPVVQAVQGQAAVICDGGVRRGSDIVKAIALGADACLVGRAYLYGLGAAGERGVDHVLGLLRDRDGAHHGPHRLHLGRRHRLRPGALADGCPAPLRRRVLTPTGDAACPGRSGSAGGPARRCAR